MCGYVPRTDTVIVRRMPICRTVSTVADRIRNPSNIQREFAFSDSACSVFSFTLTVKRVGRARACLQSRSTTVITHRHTHSNRTCVGDNHNSHYTCARSLRSNIASTCCRVAFIRRRRVSCGTKYQIVHRKVCTRFVGVRASLLLVYSTVVVIYCYSFAMVVCCVLCVNHFTAANRPIIGVKESAQLYVRVCVKRRATDFITNRNNRNNRRCDSSIHRQCMCEKCATLS